MLPGLSLVVMSRGYSLVVMYRLLITLASLVEHGLKSSGLVVVVLGLLLPNMRNLSGLGIKPLFPALDRQILNHWTMSKS